MKKKAVATKKKVSKKKVTVSKKKVTSKKKVASKKKATVSKKKATASKKKATTAKTTSNSNQISAKERYEMIATMAYYRAERRDFATGNEMQDWLECEQIVTNMLKNM